MIGGVPRVLGATMPSLFVGQGSDFTCNCLPAIWTSLRALTTPPLRAQTASQLTAPALCLPIEAQSLRV